MNDSNQPDLRTAIGITRRSTERYAVSDVPFNAVWLHDWNTIEAQGTLLDISLGGMGVRLPTAPARGHLLHARVPLDSMLDETAIPIELDARVCGSTHLSPTTGSDDGWHIHLAIESMHPVDEKRMQEALHILHDARHA